MADIKTHLRELSVGTIIGLTLRKIPFNKTELYNGQDFFDLAKKVISNDISGAKNILDFKSFPLELREIVDNGVKLGTKILSLSHFKFNSNDKIIWLGNDTQKDDPIDLIIGDYKFSLKEDSFILKNMGLYNLLNSLTGSNYERGLHVFSTFAKKEYDEWFGCAWRKFVAYLEKYNRWDYKSENYSSCAYSKANNIVLKMGNYTSNVPKTITTNKEFMELTNPKTREKVFSKWINAYLADDYEYLKIKKHCSEVAGEKVSSIIRTEFDEKNIYDFFRIYEFEYYYAKTTSFETTILRVPNKTNFSSSIKFIGCRYEVPSSQLNIISTFKNVSTGIELEFRNECRFSHGQFNGTPEAKMYVVRDTPLTALYIPLI